MCYSSMSNLSLDPQHPCKSQVGSPHTCDSSNRKTTRRKHMRLAGQLVFSNQRTLGSVKNPISKNKVQNNWKHTKDHDLYMYPDKCVYAPSCTHIYREKQKYNKNMKPSAKYIHRYINLLQKFSPTLFTCTLSKRGHKTRASETFQRLSWDAR